MWAYIVSVYYLACRDGNGMLDDDNFYVFLKRITAFIWAHMLMTKSVINMLRPPLFTEMVSIVNGTPAKFWNYRFNSKEIQKNLQNFTFTNRHSLTRLMLTWWAFHDDDKQVMLSLESRLEIESLYSKRRQDEEHGLSDAHNLNAIGNKILVESRIKNNISPSDYRFADKANYYKGIKAKKKKSRMVGTQIQELSDLAKFQKDFNERDIVQRTATIFSEFIKYLKANELLQG